MKPRKPWQGEDPLLFRHMGVKRIRGPVRRPLSRLMAGLLTEALGIVDNRWIYNLNASDRPPMELLLDAVHVGIYCDDT